jgi:RNA polymerase sigma-70 factor (ECF subfamily)
MRVWQHRDELRVATSVLPYLYRVVRNLAVDERRKQATQRRWFETSPPEHRSPPTPLEVLEADETRSATERAIAQLPPRRREVFVLAHQHDLTYRQIADIMAISPQTVANHLSAALSDLRAALSPVLTEQMDPANH